MLEPALGTDRGATPAIRNTGKGTAVCRIATIVQEPPVTLFHGVSCFRDGGENDEQRRSELFKMYREGVAPAKLDVGLAEHQSLNVPQMPGNRPGNDSYG